MILEIQHRSVRLRDVGDEIWHEPLDAVLSDEAARIAAGCLRRLGTERNELTADQLRRRVTTEIRRALVAPGDVYRAPDGSTYSLLPEPTCDEPAAAGRLTDVSANAFDPVVAEVLCFEDLPLGSRGSRRAVVRWSDGSAGEGLRWYADEVLVCEGDLIGKTLAQLRALHFRRDRDWLQS